MTAASANAIIVKFADSDLREFPVVAADIIYRDTFVGLNPAGMLKPFEVGDEFAGIAYENVDNSAGAAAAVFCRVLTKCDFLFAFASAANLDSGRAVYATDDSTIALVGHPDAWCGRILHKDVDASNVVVIRMRQVTDCWVPRDTGAIEMIHSGTGVNPTGSTATGADFIQPGGLIASSVQGAGVTQALMSGGGFDLTLDATSEVSDASMRSPAIFLASNGCTFHAILHATVIGASTAVVFDWGFEVLTDTVASRATKTAIDALSDIALFHMDGNSAVINAQSDNGATDVASTDTGVVNVTTAVTGEKEFHVIVRPSGAVEFWIDRVRVLAATTFAVATTALLGGIINLCKTTGTEVGAIRCRKMRVCGAAGVQF